MSRHCPYRFLLRLGIFVLAAVGLVAIAALPPRSSDDLKSSSSLIVTGTVLEVTHKVEGKSPNRDDVYLLTVKVDGVEKGRDASSGSVLKIRCWTVNSRPAGWAGPSGHYQTPKKAERSRFWLVKRDDGHWEPLQPNGIAPLAAR